MSVYRITLEQPDMRSDDTISLIGTVVKFSLPTPSGGFHRYSGTLVEVGNGFIVVECDENGGHRS